MHDITDAELVYKNKFQHIGFVKEVSEGLWVPIDTDKMTIAGPTSKSDAIAIVQKNADTPVQD